MKILGTDFVWYEVSDLDRSVAFYRDVLGLSLTMLEKDRFEWAEFDVPPTTLALYSPTTENRPAACGGAGGSIMLAVDDVKAAAETLKAKNIPVTFGPFETPVCWFLEFADLDGNKIGLHQRKDGSWG